MSATAEDDATRIQRAAARGAGSVLLARLGAVVEVVAQPAYTWMFGFATFGLYAVLWAVVNIVENVADLAMTSALQRALPQARDDAARAAILKGAFLLGVGPSILLALAGSLAAAPLATLFNVAAADADALVTGIRLFAWALPLWALLEVATSALRATHAFGPEIRLRLVYEQMLRLLFAVLLWAAGVDTLGLLIAHLASLAVTAILAVRLLGRRVDLAAALAAPIDRATLRELLRSGGSVLPGNILTRLFSDLPVVVANQLAPGAAGATAAGLYRIARQIASIPQLVRMTFGHVLAPIASAAAHGERATIQALYGFSVRLSLLLAVVTAAVLIAAGEPLLGLFAPGAAAAFPILAILTAARGAEAVLGPASAIQQVLGARSLPVLNSVLGLALALAVLGLAMASGPLDLVGIALAVAVGQVGVAALSVAQLSRHERLDAFVPPFARALSVCALLCVGIALLDHALRPFGGAVQGFTTLAAWPVALWLGARYGLGPGDRGILGKAGRRIGLA